MTAKKECKDCEKKIKQELAFWIIVRYLFLGMGISFLTFSVFQTSDVMGMVRGFTTGIIGILALLAAGYGDLVVKKQSWYIWRNTK